VGHVFAAEIPRATDSRPPVKINLANRLTLLRIFLVPGLAVAMLDGRHVLAFALFAVAAVTDAIDGIVARRLNQRTTLGAILDPLADKALLLTAFVLTGSEQDPFIGLPNWLVAAVVFRDILIVVGVGVIHLLTGHVRWGPSWISKVTTNAQIYTVAAALLANCLIGLGAADGAIAALRWLLHVLIWATLVTTVASGLDYTIRGARMLSEHTDGSQPAQGR
jgi:cardiolipin synthase